MEDINILINKLTELGDKYKEYKEIIPQKYIYEMANLSDDFKNKIRNAQNENRVFKLGLLDK